MLTKKGLSVWTAPLLFRLISILLLLVLPVVDLYGRTAKCACDLVAIVINAVEGCELTSILLSNGHCTLSNSSATAVVYIVVYDELQP